VSLYVDLWIKGEELEQAKELIRSLPRLGFKAAAIELQEDLYERFEELREEAERIGLKLYRRLVLRPRARKELLEKLRMNRGRYEVISVLCDNLEVALVAVRDSRVDTVIIPTRLEYRLDRGVLALIRSRVELVFKHFLEDRRAFLETAKEVVQVLGRKAGIIASSGASNPLELRTPRQLASLLEVLGLDHERALSSVSREPYRLIEENLIKLSRSYVARGVMRLG